MTAALLQAEQIHTYYGAAHVLEGVSLIVEQGTCLAVLGRNGVGKTTLARSLVGFTPPAKGRILFEGEDIAGWSARRVVRRGIALVPQGRRVFGSLSVEENLRLPFGRRRDSAGTLCWGLDDVYEMFPRLYERRTQPGRTLSGGEQQMLAVGRALMTNPRLLILDEPTEGLAPIIIDGMMAALAHLRSTGLSLLLLEQRVEVALRLADHAIVMSSRGEIKFDGRPGDLSIDELNPSSTLS